MYYTLNENFSRITEASDSLTGIYTDSEILELPNITVFEYSSNKEKYKIINGILTDISVSEEYKTRKLLELKKEKHTENTTKAKQAVENGHVLFKNAEFETNAQTVGDLTATMLLMQAGGVETYSWLSKDDKVVELTLEDFGTLGGLIAEYKNTIWQEKYINFKTRIEQADTLSELEEIEIEY